MAGKPPRKATGNWNLKEIELLLDVLVDRGINEFELEQNGLRLRVRRGEIFESPHTRGELSTSMLGSMTGGAMMAPASSSIENSSLLTATPEASPEAQEDLHLIKSPIVGTFYASPAPSAPPFVKPGDVVQAGQVLCIIEAMKLMNEIEAEIAGEVVRIYVENGQPVEYGQSLFALRSAHKK